MNIFVAGVHGVGKTYLASQLPEIIGLVHTSASKLIKEELALPNWGLDKKVNNVDANQVALAAAVERYNAAGNRLLLDGHFVLLNAESEFVPLAAEVFKPLKIDGVILLECAPDTIASRIRERDGREVDMGHLVEFIKAERSQAQIVCDELGISLSVLNSPSYDIFVQTIVKMTKTPS